MSNKRGALGRGLGALITDSKTDVTGKEVIPANSISEIKIGSIEANPFQPRTEFDESMLDELVESIKMHGVIQPITVRKVGHDKYELISGERRTRAARLAGLKAIPAYVRVANDQAMLEMALIENIHRQDLNPMEVALSYQRLLDECKLNQEELSNRVGKNRSSVANYLRLLKLPEELQIALRDHQITMGHAKPLVTLADKSKQLRILDEIIDNDLSVRQVEVLAKTMQEEEKASELPKELTKATKPSASAEAEQFAAQLASTWQRKFNLKVNAKGSGELRIPFESEEDLKALTEKLLALSNVAAEPTAE